MMNRKQFLMLNYIEGCNFSERSFAISCNFLIAFFLIREKSYPTGKVNGEKMQ